MSGPKFSIGMAVYDDLVRAKFTAVSTLCMFPADVLEAVIFVDNNPTGEQGKELKKYADGNPFCRYVPYTERRGTAAPRNHIFKMSHSEYTIVLDPHVVLSRDSLYKVREFILQYPGCGKDLIQGPLMYDDLNPDSGPTHFNDVWGVNPANGEKSLMHGQWETDPRGKGQMPFEIGAQGLGVFCSRTDDWLGFNPKMVGFGGEEWYIHDKYRKHGRKCWCVPGFKWWHDFWKPNGRTQYPNLINERKWNYIVGILELDSDPKPFKDHFGMSDQEYDMYVAAINSGTPVPGVGVPPQANRPRQQCFHCDDFKDKTVDQIYEMKVGMPSDMNEHMPALKELAAKCDNVVELGTGQYANSTIAILAGKPKKFATYDKNDCPIARAYAESAKASGVHYSFYKGDSREVKIPECDMLFVDTEHNFQHLAKELFEHGKKVKKYLVFHDTETYGKTGTDGGHGVMPAILGFLMQNREWVVKDVYENSHGLLVLSKCQEDKKELEKGLFGQIKGFAIAKLKNTFNGGRLLPLEMAMERLQTCLVCPKRTSETKQGEDGPETSMRCSKCACHLIQIPTWEKVKKTEPGKVFFPEETCPFGKWTPRLDDGVKMTNDEMYEMMSKVGSYWEK